MTLQLNDLHAEFDPGRCTLKLFDAGHQELFVCEARNRTTADGQYGHYGNCPPGEFVLGVPSPRGSIPLGMWFIPVLDYDNNHAMAEHGRVGIGIHGGGSGLLHPFAGRQGWQVTHGCIRVQNEDLQRLAVMVNDAQRCEGRVYLTVLPRSPAVPGGADDWAPAADLAEGE